MHTGGVCVCVCVYGEREREYLNILCRLLINRVLYKWTKDRRDFQNHKIRIDEVQGILRLSHEHFRKRAIARTSFTEFLMNRKVKVGGWTLEICQGSRAFLVHLL